MEVTLANKNITSAKKWVQSRPKCSDVRLMQRALTESTAWMILLGNGYLAIRKDVCQILEKSGCIIFGLYINPEFGADYLHEEDDTVVFDSYRVAKVPNTPLVRDEIRAALEEATKVSSLMIIEFNIVQEDVPCEH